MPPPRIILYTARGCPQCRRAKAYLARKGVRFRLVDVERDAKAQNTFTRLKTRGVPVILIDDRRVDGFDPKRLDAALAR